MTEQIARLMAAFVILAAFAVLNLVFAFICHNWMSWLNLGVALLDIAVMAYEYKCMRNAARAVDNRKDIGIIIGMN